MKKVLTKKRNVFGISLTNKAVICLQVAGYLNQFKRSNNRDLSRFLSSLIINYFDSFDKHLNRTKIREIELKNNLLVLQKERDSIENQIDFIAKELSGVREINRLENNNKQDGDD
jgi:hypothetical protein